MLQVPKASWDSEFVMISNIHSSLISLSELGSLDTEVKNRAVKLGQGWVLQYRQGAIMTKCENMREMLEHSNITEPSRTARDGRQEVGG